MVLELQAWPKLSAELETIQTLKMYFPEFEICYIPVTQNRIVDSLVRTARNFHRFLCYFGCSIPF